jgi:hypothetical protein
MAIGCTVFLAACTSMQLSTFKQHARRGNDAWIAAQEVDCAGRSDDCSWRHLMKGDACLRLAGTGTAPEENYVCAAQSIERGMFLKPAWPDPSIQRQFQEKLCESLLNLPVSQSGAVPLASPDRLAEAAEELHRLAPGSVAAIYYLAKARLMQVQPQLPDIAAVDRLPVCNRLKRTLTGILSMINSAERSPLPNWERFADRYQRLSFDLGTAIRLAECY